MVLPHLRAFPRRKVFVRFLIAYCAVLSVPYAISLVLYSRILGRAEAYVTERTLTSLRQTQYIVDQYLAQMRWNTLRICENAKLKWLLTASRAGQQVGNYAVKEVIDVLRDDIGYRNDLTTTCYVYVKNADLVLTPETAYSPAFFYDSIVRSTAGREIAEWHEEVSGQYLPGRFCRSLSIQIEIGGPGLHVIPFVQSLPIGYNRDPEGYVAYLINEDAVRDLLEQVGVPERGWMCVIDESGDVLTSLHAGGTLLLDSLPLEGEQATCSVQDIGGVEMLLMCATSPSSGWRYVAAFPASFARDMIHNIRIITWTSLALLLLCGLFCASLLAYRTSRPIEAIACMMREVFGASDGKDAARYDRLDMGVSRLINTSATLQRSLERKTEFVRSILLERLLRGELQGKGIAEDMLSQAELGAQSAAYLVLVLRVRADPDIENGRLLEGLEHLRASLKDTIRRTFRCTCVVHDLSGDTSVLILGFSPGQVSSCIEQTEGFVRDFFAALPRESALAIDFAGGTPVGDLTEVHRSYEQALQALGHLRGGETGQTAWFARVCGSSEDYYFPLELESRLLSALRGGDDGKTHQILRDVWKDNFETKALSHGAQRALLYELCGTMHKAAAMHERWETATRLAHHVDASDIKQAFEQIEALFAEAVQAASRRRTSTAQELTQAIVRFLDSSFHDPELSLCATADRFALTETYLSTFFKEHTGTNFSRYVEALRLRQASRYLEETRMSVNEIARRVGYRSDKAFRRAFKRSLCVSPHAFRSSHRISLARA